MPINTKALIANTYLEMVREKSIDKVTIKDVISRCGISRQTFYYHFQDILAVIEWSVEQIFNQILTSSLKADMPYEAVYGFVSLAVENHELLEKLKESQRREHLELIFFQGIRGYLVEMFRHKGPDMEWNFSDMETALQFYTFGISGVLMNYCGSPSADVDKISKQLCQLMGV